MSAHIPVMLNEVMTSLAPKAGHAYVDGTFGRGGYSRAILDSCDCTLHAIDRDPDAVACGRKMEAEYGGRFTIHQGRFGDMDQLLESGPYDGIVLDIGVSSPQINEAARGFSFKEDGPLDMRMSQEGQSAADVINTYSADDIADIFWRYGEERKSRWIARAIVEDRGDKPFTRTHQLASLIRRIVPQDKSGIDSATRSFQGLRIYVNDELGELERGLKAATKLLAPGGRLVVVSFHSLEDRIIKLFFKEAAGKGQSISRHLPMSDETRDVLFTTSSKPVLPSDAEISLNPRARSAKLRWGVRTSAPFKEKK